jgi:hypothetical protein
MQIAYNSNGLRLFPITTAIEQLAQLGYSAIELSCQPDQLFPLDFVKEDAKVIRQAAAVQAGIMISNLHAGDRNLLGANGEPSFIRPDAEGGARRIRPAKMQSISAQIWGRKSPSCTRVR